jgi:hypothetical protein
MKINDPLEAVREIDGKVKEALSGVEPTGEVRSAVTKYLLAMAATVARSAGASVSDYLEEARQTWDESAAPQQAPTAEPATIN